ncbi:ATP-binding cassette domain-containing protein [Nesterenkonia xinjiangensis]|uniref:ABC-type transport system involved in cytochrome bd biosynthesis fused ATPase/permease subunit n=1 Tax=Nesterenkonia xinjiangensis TaxID=225327 RepID=A0A7Z0GNJ7_9MICC|nr:ATP-binding cassette domain-containing protein [Nesterenkonia xinjiangensis]NYJ78178.1 ABC-type transport system involved in cytochrome bd biosynthesis fused ATPase/permease subunit [Nesterenkonia xinjiangensis]
MMIVPELVHLSRDHRHRFRRVTGALVGVSLTHLVQALAVAGALTAVVQARPGLGALWLGVLAMAAVTRLLLRQHQQRLASDLGTAIRRQMRVRVLRRLLVPERLHDVASRAGSARLTAVDAVDGVDAYLTRYLPHVAQVAALCPLLVLAMAAFSPAAAGVLAIFVLLAVVAPRAFNRWMTTRSRERWESYDDLSADVQESLQGMRTLQLLGAVPARRRALRRRSARLHRETVRTMRTSLWESGILDLMIQAGTAVASALAILTAAGVSDGGLLATPFAAVAEDPFRIFAVLVLTSETFRPIRDVSQQWHAGFLGLSAVGTLREHGAFDADPPSPAPPENPGPDDRRRRRASGSLRLEGVHHQYPRTVSPVLRGVEAEFLPDRISVISGPSGAGKSTLFDIVLGLLEPESGQVTLADRRPHPQEIAVASQTPSLLSGTLRENLCLAAPDDVDTPMTLDACADAGLDGLLAELPEGLDTLITEGGASLSRGQAQRVAIARAYLADRPVLLMDEPTSALDTDSARHVLSRLRERAEGRIVLVISHRDDVTAVADQRWHLESGLLRPLDAASSVTAGPPSTHLEEDA